MKEEMEMKRVGDALIAAATGHSKTEGRLEEGAEGRPISNILYSTSDEVIHLSHPRSKALRGALGAEAEGEFKRIARVADTIASEISGSSLPDGQRVDRLLSALDGAASDGGATFFDKCQVAKIHVELDRLMHASEEGYRVGLYRLIRAGCQAKGDLLVGVGPNAVGIEDRRLMIRRKEDL